MAARFRQRLRVAGALMQTNRSGNLLANAVTGLLRSLASKNHGDIRAAHTPHLRVTLLRQLNHRDYADANKSFRRSARSRPTAQSAALTPASPIFPEPDSPTIARVSPRFRRTTHYARRSPVALR